MKRITLLFCVVSLLIFSGCSDDDGDDLISKTITTTDGLTIELTWTINGKEEDGFEFVDVDFVVDDLAQGEGAGAYESSSGNGFNFEDAELEDDFLDGTYLLAPFIYNFEETDEEYITSEDIQLTFKIYPGTDDSEAHTFKQKFTYRNYNPTEAVAYAKYAIVKKGDTYKIKEQSKVKEINSGWFESD